MAADSQIGVEILAIGPADSPQDVCITETIPDMKDCPAYALVMCCWNNILGPHAKHIWLTEPESEFATKHVGYLSTHTLTSCEQPHATIDTKILLLQDRAIAVTSYIFSGYDRSEKTVFALSLVLPYGGYGWYLPVHELCVARLTAMIQKLRVLQDKTKDEYSNYAMETFSAGVPPFMQLLTLLKTHGLPSSIELCDTVFAPGQTRQLDVQFTRNSISSHLQTCGCSIVIGKTPSDVNLMISTLALFLSPSERRSCLYLDCIPRTYQEDLLIQGFVKDTINLDDYLRSVITSRYPTTLIDMVTLEVKQTPLFNDHAFRRHEVINMELHALWFDREESTVFIPVVNFSNKHEADTLVQDFLNEMFLLQCDYCVRATFIDEFMRTLDRKAVALIKYVEEETNRGTKPNRLKVRQLKQDLNLVAEGDFRIVLAVAEKLQPGIYTFVCGNPANLRDVYSELLA